MQLRLVKLITSSAGPPLLHAMGLGDKLMGLYSSTSQSSNVPWHRMHPQIPELVDRTRVMQLNKGK